MTKSLPQYTRDELLALREHLEAVRKFYSEKPLDSRLSWLDPDEIEMALDDVDDLLASMPG